MELLVYAELCYIAPHLVVGAAVGEHGGETFLQVPLGTEKWGGYVRAKDGVERGDAALAPLKFLRSFLVPLAPCLFLPLKPVLLPSIDLALLGTWETKCRFCVLMQLCVSCTS